MRAVITGGSGFLGTLLARRLLSGPLSVGGAPPRAIGELVVADLVPPAADVAGDPRTVPAVGEIVDRIGTVDGADVVFHLAGVVSAAAESDFDLGLRVNVDGLRAVLDWCRRQSPAPVFVFTSSLAVYGSDPAIGHMSEVDDDTLPRPQSSYGVQKFIGEQLVADYTRKGFVRGRSVRLMTVAVRPGAPNAAASGFLSGIIREPIAGLPARCPVPPETPVAISSPSRTIAGIIRATEVEDRLWGSTTAMNLPALTTTPTQMAAALDRVVGPGTSELIGWSVDPSIATIVESWPARFHTPRAAALGLTPDTSVDDLIIEYLHGRLGRQARP